MFRRSIRTLMAATVISATTTVAMLGATSNQHPVSHTHRMAPVCATEDSESGPRYLPAGVLTDEVGVITGDVVFTQTIHNNDYRLTVRYAGTADQYTVTRCATIG